MTRSFLNRYFIVDRRGWLRPGGNYCYRRQAIRELFHDYFAEGDGIEGVHSFRPFTDREKREWKDLQKDGYRCVKGRVVART